MVRKMAVRFSLQRETAHGDRVFAVGGHPDLGGWELGASKVELTTSDKSYPLWSAKWELAAGPGDMSPRLSPSEDTNARVEGGEPIPFKFVVQRSDGPANWETGIGNRTIEVHGDMPHVTYRAGFNEPRAPFGTLDDLDDNMPTPETPRSKADDNTSEGSHSTALPSPERQGSGSIIEGAHSPPSSWFQEQNFGETPFALPLPEAQAGALHPVALFSHQVSKFKSGDVVMVLKAMEANSKPKVQLREGERGKVIRIDNDGDALIDFKGHKLLQWVRHEQYDKLHLACKQLSRQLPNPYACEGVDPKAKVMDAVALRSSNRHHRSTALLVMIALAAFGCAAGLQMRTGQLQNKFSESAARIVEGARRARTTTMVRTGPPRQPKKK
mmetsp:Transcript_14879/g.38197  ORF Transcript_14879/g.38197 Transcript_14879/m.38197 type:complete len:384 (+) Transcript_14879:108-1259(+)